MALQGFDTDVTFGWVTKLLHWITTVFVLSLFVIGLYMVDLAISPQKFKVYALHKSIGITVLILVLLRIGWRCVNPTPPILGNPKSWERMAARSTHVLFYVLLIVLPLSGWMRSSAASFPFSWFGLFQVPDIVAPNEALSETAKTVHWWLGRILGILVVVHILAALKHHFLNRDGTLVRMLPRLGNRK